MAEEAAIALEMMTSEKIKYVTSNSKSAIFRGGKPHHKHLQSLNVASVVPVRVAFLVPVSVHYLSRSNENRPNYQNTNHFGDTTGVRRHYSVVLITAHTTQDCA